MPLLLLEKEEEKEGGGGGGGGGRFGVSKKETGGTHVLKVEGHG